MKTKTREEQMALLWWLLLNGYTLPQASLLVKMAERYAAQGPGY